MSHYDDVRGHLIEMLEDLDERLKKITDGVKGGAPASDRDVSGQSGLAANHRATDWSENPTLDEIAKVEQAISRIDGGTYGICLLCGAPIRKESLQAAPYSLKCTHCARKSED